MEQKTDVVIESKEEKIETQDVDKLLVDLEKTLNSGFQSVRKRAFRDGYLAALGGVIIGGGVMIALDKFIKK